MLRARFVVFQNGWGYWIATGFVKTTWWHEKDRKVSLLTFYRRNVKKNLRLISAAEEIPVLKVKVVNSEQGKNYLAGMCRHGARLCQ
jgi:hypothetical protein